MHRNILVKTGWMWGGIRVCSSCLVLRIFRGGYVVWDLAQVGAAAGRRVRLGVLVVVAFSDGLFDFVMGWQISHVVLLSMKSPAGLLGRFSSYDLVVLKYSLIVLIVCWRLRGRRSVCATARGCKLI